MPEPITIAVIIASFAKNTPFWLDALRGTLLDKGKEVALDKGKDYVVGKGTGFMRGLLRLDEKEQQHHLELVLKNSVERGLAKFHTDKERTQYRAVLGFLTQSGPNSEALGREALRLFTLSDSPDFTMLSEKYNLHQRISSYAEHKQYEDVDAGPYLNSFFDALIAELYLDPYFRQQMSDVLRIRAAVSMQRSLTEVVTTLRQIGEALAENYTPEQFEREVAIYTAHIERTLHYLKLIGIVPKDRSDKDVDPEINGIFVPLRIAIQGQALTQDQTQDSIIDLLEKFPCLVLLGGPGSGKSTITRHLAWSHAAANQSNSSATSIPLLSGNPLPLRIELRRLTEDRRHHPDYNFLSYATEVLLGREGLEINTQLFKELLERRTMLLLFDGLDEVATLDERRLLVEEIEHFASCYPGNRILVTSRPVGYDLASFSSQSFSHARVQEFNNDQIRQFLERWYRHVLRLSPIPYEDQQELEVLFETLRENIRLHRLAENPLLLTVITMLHRYERLPDKRVLIYDRCADVLLDSWARLKGTNKRWKDMKMIKEDQYACIAHIGFVLHERSQEKEIDSRKRKANQSIEDTDNDVSTRFMLREIEYFLHSRKLIAEVAEQRAEAKRFLELMQIEAGLIVERGTDENGEALYGFVHRTFQEYFTAADVYERYQQEEDSAIISQFLVEHMHDPHWREVILLLLGKLKRKPATVQLRQILEGKIKSRRSLYIDVVLQDLFFVSSCLIDEIAVENELAEDVVRRLSETVNYSPFPSQKEEALRHLGLLVRTRQYADHGQKELTAIVSKDTIIDTDMRIEAARILYLSTLSGSEEEQQAIRILLHLAQQSDLSFISALHSAETLYEISLKESKEQQQAIQLLLQLTQRPDLSPEQTIQAASALYRVSPPTSEEEKIATQWLLKFTQHPDLLLEQIFQATLVLNLSNSQISKEPQIAILVLLYLIKYPNLSVEQAAQATLALYISNSKVTEELRTSIQELLYLVRFFDPLVMPAIQQALKDYQLNSKTSGEQRFATQLLLQLVQHSNLSIEQTIQVAEILYRVSSPTSEEEKVATQLLLQLAQRPDLTIEQAIQAATALHMSSSKESEEEKVATQLLLQLAQRPDLTIEQAIQAATALHMSSSKESEERKVATQLLLQLAQRPDLTIEQAIQAATAFEWSSYQDSEGQRLTTQLLSQLVQRPDLTIEQTIQAALGLDPFNYSESEKRNSAIQLLSQLVQRPDLTTEQIIQVAEVYYWSNSRVPEKRRSATQMLKDIAQNKSLTVDQRLQASTKLLTMQPVRYLERAHAIQTVLALLGGEAAGQYLKENWIPISIRPEVSDIPVIVDLAKQKMLPTEIRDEMYQELRRIVPQFNKVTLTDEGAS